MAIYMRLLYCTLLTTLLLVVVVKPAFSDIAWITTLDENKMGSYIQNKSGAKKVTLSFTFAVDPLTGAKGPMFYLDKNAPAAIDFTEKLTEGDVVIYEGTDKKKISDLLRFERIKGYAGEKTGGANVFFFYSDNDGDKDASDSVPMPTPLKDAVTATEDNKGKIKYTPTPKQPGGLSTAKGDSVFVQYIASSDCSSDGSCSPPVPEPSMLPALVPTITVLFAYAARRARMSSFL